MHSLEFVDWIPILKGISYPILTLVSYHFLYKDCEHTYINLNEEIVSIGLAMLLTSNSITPLGPLRNKRTWKSSELPKFGDTFEARATELFESTRRAKSSCMISVGNPS